MTAFVAVMLALVSLSFLSSARTPPDYSLDLPITYTAAAQQGALRDDAVFVAIQRDGMLWVNASRITPKDLAGKIREGVAQSGLKKVYINVDRHVGYGHVIETVDAIQSAGVSEIAFLSYRVDDLEREGQRFPKPLAH